MLACQGSLQAKRHKPSCVLRHEPDVQHASAPPARRGVAEPRETVESLLRGCDSDQQDDILVFNLKAPAEGAVF